MTADIEKKDTSKFGADFEAMGTLGRQLKKNYSQLLNEPVPDRFMALLKQLEERPVKKEARAAGAQADDTAEQPECPASPPVNPCQKDE